MNNPWRYYSEVSRQHVETCDCVSRLEIVKEADVDKLRKIIAWPETQSSVRKRAQGRLATLIKRQQKATEAAS